MDDIQKASSTVTGLPNTAAKAFFILREYVNAGKSAVFLAEDEEELEDLHDCLKGLAMLFTDIPPYESVHFGETESSRSVALSALSKPCPYPRIITATYDSIKTEIPDPNVYLRANLRVKRRDTLDRHGFLGALSEAGYERTEFVEQAGEYAVRGSVVDVFSPAMQRPVRLYFAGNRVETISPFDIETQTAAKSLDETEIIPAKLSEGKGRISAWLDPSAHYLLDDADEAAHLNAPPERITAILPLDPGTEATTDYGAATNISFNASMEVLGRETQRLHDTGYRPVLSFLNRGEMQRMEELLSGTPAAKLCRMAITPLRQGFRHTATKTAIITSCEILGRSYAASRALKKFDSSAKARIRFRDLRPGDFVVHEDYGIGRFRGLRTVNPSFDEDKPPQDMVECLLLEYKNGHRLFVPLYDFKKIQKYIGSEGRMPRLSSLDGKTWADVKERVRQGTEEVAKELLKAEAKRQAARTEPLTDSGHLEREFADSFPYEETKDQREAIEQVLEDMSQQRPMDRVLAGDVGFGKTEVAIRAALRCALSGKQTLVIVPTTILAAQHYKTFSERMAGYPVKIGLLSRFQTKKEQKEIVAGLKDGIYDIVVGTHRLLSKDIGFKHLGLCILDEEHRFGVKQKERIRTFASGVHTLMLSATPIPRTLNQALSGLRGISIIETPPEGRVPVSTRVLAWDEKIAAEAIREELARGGQIFYVHNKVTTLPSRLAFLKKLVPEAKIAMGHGQMNSEDLESTLWDFYNRKYDILLASTIIESGLDIPSVNTLIVENAQDFGLAQLYQLRGRIGRGSKKAYGYFFYPPWLAKSVKEPPPEDEYWDEDDGRRRAKKPETREQARQRLAALNEFSELGSGFRLAMRDLEIRGAGELLGTQQHGFLNEIGLTLYCELLEREIKKLRGGQPEKPPHAVVEMPLQAYIGPDYLPDETQRLNYYKKLLDADEAKADAILAELENLSGPAPEPLKTLISLVKLRAAAGKAGIRRIERTPEGLEIYFSRQARLCADAAPRILRHFGGSARFINSPHGDGISIAYSGSAPLAFARECYAFLSGILLKC